MATGVVWRSPSSTQPCLRLAMVCALDQFITQYQHSSGRYRLRATTVSGPWHNDPNEMSAVGRSFDQEAACVLMTRIAVHRTGEEEGTDLTTAAGAVRA